MNDRVEVIKAVFAGIKELILATAALATIWIQAQNSGKLDTAAAKTELVKSELTATKLEQDNKLDQIAGKAEAIFGGVDASVKSWRAYNSKEPDDMNAAVEAVAKAERMTEPRPAAPMPNP